MTSATEELARRRFLSRLLGLTGGVAASLFAPRLLAASHHAALRHIGVRRKGDGLEVSFDLSAPVEHHLFTLENPPRVVVDFDHAVAAAGLGLRPAAPIRELRYAHRRDGLRVVLVLDGKQVPRLHSQLFHPRHIGEDYRLALDIHGHDPMAWREPAQGGRPGMRDVVVMIDPGHGGKDPGAIGQMGTEEKHVVLDIGRRLAARIDRRPGMRSIMTRDRDRFISLGERVRMARDHNADLFVSVHADASPYHYAKGSTVYVLSEHGASSVAAQLLAQRQNSADRISGVSLKGKNRLLAEVLVDMEQTATYASSLSLGEKLTDSIGDVVPLHSRQVEHAAFVVLKSPDVPSVLVETAFISNAPQERLLRTVAFRRQIADAMMNGIDDYFRHHAPPGTLIAARQARMTG